MSKYFCHRPNRCLTSFLISRRKIEKVKSKAYLSHVTVIALFVLTSIVYLFI
ncbi:GD17675 [Drosophila simulans]|uniref:GD17675 n=1 Tax=Drosophila simulans TaxID=7240 RepID=B4NSU2_DROSI|nr:GD17675 [Drosophila simulans]